ncbi:hypothetical protein BCR41DRAFT_331739 [Lobosporangium transversale]|uniref:Uncharacterized protein n=1 Tax=Lobosporangium transversale TaxID=64571 RepID=A0A1Y2H1V8_9FUNG|nr:hypothetical protein BCR41DRAFT_331739 [Lobosporangium transversale]ORZ27981.1 hypothetical protein BCR41DRAFT_331739 [Lobosporangium transversale]|eukprot:XP_021885684.1 hypothetical protein BCR41DRAFT_331739 [Lobosporangium transversale]
MPLTSINDRLRWKEKPYDPTSPSPPSATNSSTMLSSSSSSSSGPSTRKSAPKPLILYSPEDVERHCPCTLVFNVLSKDLATRLLQAMLIDSETWDRNRWWFFERMVESPHKRSYFAEHDDDMEEIAGWTYNGQKQEPPRRFLKEMEEAKLVIRKIVNDLRKTRAIHPYEVQGDWNCNVAAANYYAHSKESVGWHADKLTYLGPRPTIGSLTLGATRFFRVRKMVPDVRNPDTAGQLISIALPHNSLCIMWPPMQEEWKHEVPPQARVTPHPISGTARINITFRLRREGFSPADTPVCKCGIAMVLRCVFKNKANYGRYFYMCYASGSQEGRTCGAFQWVDMEEKLGLVKKYSTSLSNSSSPSSPSSLPCLPSPSNTCTSITPPSTSISSTTASTTVAVTVETTLESAGKPEAVNSNEKKLSMSQPAICDMSKVKDQIEDKEQDQALDLANELDDADLVDLADLSFEGISESDFAE